MFDEDDEKNLSRKMLYDFLPKLEGNEEGAYADNRGNMTIGAGFNMDAPGAERHLANVGADPEKLRTGEDILNPDQSKKLLDSKIYEKEQLFDNLQKNSFPTTKLNPAQRAAMLSMMYNSPALVGPQMAEHLNQGDHNKVIQEMLTNSNGKKDAGILKRRLQEAELYGGPVDFNLAIKNLSPEQLEDLRSIMSGMKNDNERSKVLERYPFLNKEQTLATNNNGPVLFNKLKRGLNNGGF